MSLMIIKVFMSYVEISSEVTRGEDFLVIASSAREAERKVKDSFEKRKKNGEIKEFEIQGSSKYPRKGETDSYIFSSETC